MSDPSNPDDSRLLDWILDPHHDTAPEDALAADARARLEELRRVHAALRSLAQENATAGMSEAAMAAVLRRVEADPTAATPPVVALRSRRRRPLVIAAAVMILAGLAWAAFGPRGATGEVEAGVFGGLALIRNGTTVVAQRVDRLRVRAGDVILSRGGGELDFGDGYFVKLGQDARLACLHHSEHGLVLGLEEGRLRCEHIRAGRGELTIRAGTGLTLKARAGAIFAVQAMGREDDQLEVDEGAVTVHCRNAHPRTDVVTAESGPYSLRASRPYATLSDAQRAALEPCHRRGERPVIRLGLPAQSDPDRALRLARRHHVPVLVTRADGPETSPCYRSCCFVDFVAKCRGFGGMVWLVLDPAQHAPALARYDLAGEARAVTLLDDRGRIIDRGRIESGDDLFGTVITLIRAGRAQCRH